MASTDPQPETPDAPVCGRPRFFLWRTLVLGKARRRWRWLVRVVAAAVIIFIAAVILLTHSPLTKYLIIPRLEAACGMKIEADSIHIRRTGELIIDNARVSIPGVPGEAGKFLRIARVQAGVDWRSMLSGTPRVTSVNIIDPVMIVSQSTTDGSLNIGSVPIPASGGGNMAMPGITLSNLGLEIGEHDRLSYRALKRIQMDGAVTPVADARGAFDVHLQETTAKSRARSATQPGFNLDGRVTQDQIELTLVNFSLSDWPASTMPSSIREISEKLAVTGQVPSTHFTYTRKEGSTARMELRNVAMNLPVEPETMGPPAQTGDQIPAPRWMRMSGVDGSITFARNSVTVKVGGLIEDLPYRVSLRYDGVDENSAFNLDFVSEDFPLDKNPGLLVYAPPMVKYYLREVFLRPTGIVTTNVNVKRGPPVPAQGDQPAQPGPITVSGSLDFHDGSAAYEGFPYEFQQMAGRFEFDNDQIKIIRVAGTSPTGAKLLAKGRIAPLDETSEVRISIDVSDAQIDEALQSAFGQERSRVITALFNEVKHKELLDAGLIRTPQQSEDETRELETLLGGPPLDSAGEARVAVLQARRKVPVFAFRGSANVSIDILSPRGENAPYLTSVDIRLPSVGLIPEKFPYPIVASDVMVEVRNTQGRLSWGNFKGVNGGRADIDANFKVPGKLDVDAQVRPDIDIQLSDLPLDEFIVHALPGPVDSPVKRIMTQLGLTGAGSGTVRIAPRSDKGDSDLGFDADIDITAAEARPGTFKGSSTVAVAGITGHFETSETKLFLDLDGVPVLPPPEQTMGPPLPLAKGERVGGTLTVHVRGEFPPTSAGKPANYFVASTCPNFDLASPFESVVGVFSETAGDAVVRARRDYDPGGFVDVRTTVEAESGKEVQLNVDLTSGRSLAANLLGGTLVIPESSGTVSLFTGTAPEGGSTTQARFDAVSGTTLFSGQASGIVSIDGTFPLGRVASTASSLEVTLLDARFESSLTRGILEQRLGADAMSFYRRVDPSGQFDATILVRPQAEGGLTAQGTIEPRTLALRIGDKPVEFATVGGAIEFEPGSGVLRQLTLEAPEWSARADGGWTLSPDGAVTFRSALTARGNKLSDDLRAVLPPELGSLFDDLKLKLSGPFRLSDATLDLMRSGGELGPKSAAQFSGRLDFTDAALEAGVPISDMNGALLVRFDNSRGLPDFRLDLKADRFEVAGITLEDGRAVVQSAKEPGHIRIPEASGACHGGRFSVRADVEPAGTEEGGPRRFSADFHFAGVRFSSLLRELIDSVKPFVGPPAPPEADPLAESGPAPAKLPAKDEFSRGLMDGELTIEGIVGDSASRRGRGLARVSGGRVLNLPVVTAFIEATNLQFPFNSSLDFAQARFFIEGGLITFEDLSVQSRAIELVGRGTMTWPERWLDLTFISRAARPIPIISDIIQGIRNQLIVTSVTGKLGEHVMSLQTPGPTRMLEGSGGRESRQSRERADVERAAAAERERIRRRGHGIGSEPPRE